MDNFPATKTVHWASGPVNACEHHAAQLVGLAGFLGTHVGVTPAPDGSQCGNCQNECDFHICEAEMTLSAFQPTHRHAEGGLYQVVDGDGLFHLGGQWVPAVIYRCKNNGYYCRTKDEFERRFTALECEEGAGK